MTLRRCSGGLFALSILLVSSSPAYSAETRTYTYDALGRVVKVQNTGTVNNNRVRSFCYDKAGNRIEFDSSSTGTPLACVTQG